MKDERETTPFLPEVHLQWFSDADPGATGDGAGQGQGGAEGDEPTPGAAGQGGGAPAAGALFHEWTDPDGKRFSWKDKAALDAELKSNFYRHDKFSRDQQSLAAERQRLAAMAKSIDEMGKEYSAWQNFFTKYPKLYQEFKQRIDRGPDADDTYGRMQSYLDKQIEAIKKEFTPYKDRLDERQFLEEIDRTYDELEAEVEGFDRKKVDELAQQLGSQKDRKMLFKLLHFALVGQMNPEERLRQQAEQEETARRADLGGGAGSPTPSPKAPKTIEEGRQRALAEARGR